MTRVKICGITRPEDALAAVRAGVDSIGLQFVEWSSRCVTIEQAMQIRKEIPSSVSVVGVFVNEKREDILRTVELVGLDYVQLHGDETADFVRELGVPTIKTVGVESQKDLYDLERYPADALLLDTKVDGQCGGTGQSFDWSLLNGFTTSIPLILAGGLRAENIVAAIRAVRPQEVDLCSGVESAKGIKSYEKMREYIKIVQKTDAEL
ncbi:MAG: phosphoribosylanthranilate isomerase [Oceanospirillaceae bacterium]|nr:phosphoribosylanthranilate isomerase [Oceanospirillaceae bacterium]